MVYTYDALVATILAAKICWEIVGNTISVGIVTRSTMDERKKGCPAGPRCMVVWELRAPRWDRPTR